MVGDPQDDATDVSALIDADETDRRCTLANRADAASATIGTSATIASS